MSALTGWTVGALLGSTILMLLVLAVRGPVRRLLGPHPAYLLWALPMVRILTPPLPASFFAASTATSMGARLSVLIVGPRGTAPWQHMPKVRWTIDEPLLAAWLIGAMALLGVHLVRHVRFGRRLLASASDRGRRGSIRIVNADVDGPLAFGVFRRFVAVPHDFADRYDAREQELVISHECAHHARFDLIANWAALAVLAVHWWNPVAWMAHRAFREDQECAVDAHVLRHGDPTARPAYARVLAKAAGYGTLAVCNLTPRSNLKGRLMMLTRQPASRRRMIAGGGGVAIMAAAALAATVPATGATTPTAARQAVTIGVKPDGKGTYSLIIDDVSVAPGARLPGGTTLPSDFTAADECDLKPSAEPVAMVIKGSGGIRTYTVMCASAKPAPVRATLTEGLASLRKMRAMVATQQATPAFPETERSHALGAIDRSIRDVEATLASAT